MAEPPWSRSRSGIRPFRFGFNIRSIRSRDEVASVCRAAERYGYDVALVPDHLGRNRPAPFPMLVAVAHATDRLRVGPFVLNVGFWNPSLLAREAATTDRLTGGRLELGLGAGHMKAEFDAAGILWQRLGDRVKRVEATIDELDRLFGDDQQGYDSAQRPRPPLLIAGTGDRMLSLAARRADIVGYGAILQVPGQPPGTFRLITASEMDERVRYFRREAGGRADQVEANLLVQRVVVTADRRAAAEQLVTEMGLDLTPQEILEAPALLLGTAQEIAEQLRERRERFGISYLSVHEPYL
jgi:probable F420-dependent oxidoreductase